MFIDLSDIHLSPKNAAEALNALSTIARRLREQGDARAVVPDLYAIITRRVLTAVESGDVFLEPAWLSRLAGRFAELYIETLVSSLREEPVGCDAWQFAHSQAVQGGTLAVQDAVLGISAHINYDLAQGLAANIRAHGAVGDERMMARYRHDHDVVNAILRDAIPECLDMLASRYGCRVTRAIASLSFSRKLACDATLVVLQVWRDRVWGDLQDLLAAESKADEQAVLARMANLSGRIAQVLSTTSVAWSALRRLVPGRVLDAISRAVTLRDDTRAASTAPVRRSAPTPAPVTPAARSTARSAQPVA
jgi:hypothetical protein